MSQIKRSLQKEDKRRQCYVSRWLRIRNKLMYPPLDYFDEHDWLSRITVNFIVRANDHLEASWQALQGTNIHSLVMQSRVIDELNSRIEPIMLSTIALSDADRLDVASLLLADTNSAFVGAARLEESKKREIAKIKAALERDFLNQITQSGLVLEEGQNLSKRRSFYYSPGYFNLSKNLKKIDDNYHEHAAIDDEVASVYRQLSSQFVHPHAGTLENVMMHGGVFRGPSSVDEQIYCLLMFNSRIRWCLYSLKFLYFYARSALDNWPDLSAFTEAHQSKLSVSEEVEGVKEEFHNLIKEARTCYESIIESHLKSSVGSNAKLLRLHKFFMHSVTAEWAADNYNLSACSAELTVMKEMLDKCGGVKSDKCFGNFIAMFKHPRLSHLCMGINEGGVIYRNKNELACTTIQYCSALQLSLWAQALTILAEQLGDDAAKSTVVNKALQITRQFNKLLGDSKPILMKHK